MIVELKDKPIKQIRKTFRTLPRFMKLVVKTARVCKTCKVKITLV